MTPAARITTAAALFVAAALVLPDDTHALAVAPSRRHPPSSSGSARTRRLWLKAAAISSSPSPSPIGAAHGGTEEVRVDGAGDSPPEDRAVDDDDDGRDGRAIPAGARRAFLAGITLAAASASSSSLAPPPALAAPPPLPSQPRIEEIGGGFDLLSPPPLGAADVIFPESMVGPWTCRRVVTKVDGDAEQARVAWGALGGCGCGDDMARCFAGERSESFDVRFVAPPSSGNGGADGYRYQFDGGSFVGVVSDRGFEMESRLGGTGVGGVGGGNSPNIRAEWNVGSPDVLAYETDAAGGRTSRVTLTVVQRSVELPSEKGFGSNELVRIETAAGGLIPGDFVRAARVQRRYRRAVDPATGDRVVEGLEVVKTYRVLDGVAGVEFPTSTTKSQLRLTRPLRK